MNSLKSKTIVPRDELEHNVKDLLVFCFQHWRSALVLMLSAVLLFGLIGGVSAFRREELARELLSHSYDEYLAKLDNGESLSGDEHRYLSALRQNEAVNAIDRKAAQITSYLDHSLLMRIDPRSVSSANTTVVLLPDDPGDQNAIGNLLLTYRGAILGGAYLDNLAETLGTKSEYLRELISVTVGAAIELPDGSGRSISIDSSYLMERIRQSKGISYPFYYDSIDGVRSFPSSVLELRVIAATPELAAQIMDAILAELNVQQPQMAKNVAPHTLRTLNHGIFMENDSSLMDSQLERRLSLSDLPQLRSTYATWASQPAGASGGSVLSAAMKGGAVAAVAIILGYCLLLCLRYLFSERPLTEIRFQQHYRLLPLAAFRSAARAVYRRRTAFDRWLRRADRMLVDENESAAVYELAAGNLQLYAGELHSVLITGSAAIADKQALAAALGERLESTNFVAVSSLVGIHERLKLAGADGVIFFESFDTARFPSLSEEILLTERAGVSVLGSVLQ